MLPISFKLKTKFLVSHNYLFDTLFLRNNLNYTFFLNAHKSYLKQLILSIKRANKHRFQKKNVLNTFKKKHELSLIWQSLNTILKKKQQLTIRLNQKTKHSLHNGVLTNSRKLQYHTGDQTALLLQYWRSSFRVKFSQISAYPHYKKNKVNLNKIFFIAQTLNAGHTHFPFQGASTKKWLFFYYNLYKKINYFPIKSLGAVLLTKEKKINESTMYVSKNHNTVGNSGLRKQKEISLLTKVNIIKKLGRSNQFGKKKTPMDLALQSARSNPRKAFVKENLHLRQYFQKIKYLIKTKRTIRRLFFKVSRGQNREAKALVFGNLLQNRLIYVLKQMRLIPETALGIYCIRLGFFLVNNIVITNIFYRLRPGDIIHLHPTIFLGVAWLQMQASTTPTSIQFQKPSPLLANFPEKIIYGDKNVFPGLAELKTKLNKSPVGWLLFQQQFKKTTDKKNINYIWYYFIKKLQQQLQFRRKYPMYSQHILFPFYYMTLLQIPSEVSVIKSSLWRIKTKIHYLNYWQHCLKQKYNKYLPQNLFNSNKRLLLSVLKIIYNLYGSQFFLTKYFFYLWSLRATAALKTQSIRFHVNYQTLTGIVLEIPAVTKLKTVKMQTKLIKRLYNNFKYIL